MANQKELYRGQNSNNVMLTGQRYKVQEKVHNII